VAYQFFNEEGTRYDNYEAIRQTYDGPVSMADDLMVWNITRDKTTERMTVPHDKAWDVAGPTYPPAPDNKFPKQESDFILKGRWQPAIEVDNEAFRDFREKHGLAQPDAGK
jgi:ribonuclease Z